MLKCKKYKKYICVKYNSNVQKLSHSGTHYLTRLLFLFYLLREFGQNSKRRRKIEKYFKICISERKEKLFLKTALPSSYLLCQ